jgi:hypothetical protein
MSAAIYCPTCGYPNDYTRGACLLCYTNVRDLRGGAACPSCGADNAKTASFCTQCQAALAEGVVPQMLPDVSGLVGAAAAAAAGGVVMSDDYVGEAAGDMDFGLTDAGADEYGTAGDFADDFAAPPPPPPAADTGPGAFAATPAALDFGEEEDYGAPPPPPDTVDLDFDDSTAAPPPPPGTDQLPADTGAGEDELGDWSLDYDQ